MRKSREKIENYLREIVRFLYNCHGIHGYEGDLEDEIKGLAKEIVKSKKEKKDEN